MLNQPRTNGNMGRTLKFWLYQLWGWFPFALSQLAIIDESFRLTLASLIYSGLATSCAILGSLLLRLIYRVLSRRQVSGMLWFIAIVVSSLITATCADLVFHSILYPLSKSLSAFAHLYAEQPFLSTAPFIFICYLFWSSFYLVITRNEHLIHVNAEKQAIELSLRESQLKNLEQQLKPHFIFNAINNIRALVAIDPEKARDMLLCFADLIRYQVNYDDSDLVSVNDELVFVRDYVSLISLHMGDRLEFSQDISLDLTSHKIPRMAIQLLVENAVKHGSKQNVDTLKIQLCISGDSSHWEINVINDGVLIRKNSPGIGLTNLRERLAYHFEDKVELDLFDVDGKVCSRIKFY